MAFETGTFLVEDVPQRDLVQIRRSIGQISDVADVKRRRGSVDSPLLCGILVTWPRRVDLRQNDN